MGSSSGGLVGSLGVPASPDASAKASSSGTPGANSPPGAPGTSAIGMAGAKAPLGSLRVVAGRGGTARPPVARAARSCHSNRYLRGFLRPPSRTKVWKSPFSTRESVRVSLDTSVRTRTAPTFSLASAVRIRRPVHAPMRIDPFESQMSPRCPPDHQTHMPTLRVARSCWLAPRRGSRDDATRSP